MANVRFCVLSAQAPAVLLSAVIFGGSSARTTVLAVLVHPVDDVTVTIYVPSTPGIVGFASVLENPFGPSQRYMNPGLTSTSKVMLSPLPSQNGPEFEASTGSMSSI